MADGLYAWEKLYEAVLTLSSGRTPLPQRLMDAYLPALSSIRPEHHFPWPDLRERFERLHDDLAPNGRTDIAMAAWGEADLHRIATEIVGLYDAVTKRVAAQSA